MRDFRPDLKRRSLLAWPACLVLPPAWAAGAANATANSRPLVLGTSTPGGGFSLYGQTLERVLNARAGRPVLQAVMTRGTTENLARLRSGDLDAALIQGTSASEVLDQGPASGLRILWAMYPSPGMLAVPAASSAQRLQDLVGQPVVFGVRTSGLVTLARQVFSGIELDIDKDFQAIYVEQAAQSPGLVQSGQARGLWGAGEGWPGFEQLARGPGGARFIGPGPEQTADILKKFPLLKALDVPVGTYPGMNQPLSTVGSVNLILTHDRLPDARAQAFVAAMEAAASDLTAALPQAAFSTRANTLASTPSAELLHPALRRS